MSKIISIIEEKKELVIKHESQSESPSFLGTIIYVIVLFILMVGAMANLINILFFIVGTLGVLGASMFPALSPKIQNKLSINIKKNQITIDCESEYIKRKKVRNYSFDTKDIRRIYLTRDRKSNRIRGYGAEMVYCYEIWGEKHNGSKVRLLGVEEGFSVEKESQARIVMDRMIAFLQGQIGTIDKQRLQNSPRAIEKEENITKMTIKDLTKGVLVDYHDETWEVIGQIQYDWKQGNTDSLYQLSNAKNVAMLLLVSQDMAIYTTSVEERLRHYDLVKHQLDKVHQEAPLKFIFNDITFFKERVGTGYEFVTSEAQGAKIKQWKYLSEDKQHSLRILKHEDDEIFAFSGKEIKGYEFSKILAVKY